MNRNYLAFFTTLLLSFTALSCTKSQGTEQYYQPNSFEGHETTGQSYSDERSPQQNSFVQYHQVGLPQTSYAEQYNQQAPSPSMGHNPTNQTNQGGLTMQPLINPQTGMPTGYYPLPSSWSIKKDGWYGPNGIEVKFFNSQLHDVQQTPYQSPEQFLRSTLSPLIRKEGGTIKGTYQLPAIAQTDQKYRELIQINPGQERNMVSVLGVDVYEPTGSGLIIVKSHKNITGHLTAWYNEVIMLSAKDADLERAKQTLIYALANFQPNMAQANQYLQSQRQQTGNSWASHNRRMANKRQNFNATNQANQSAHAAVNQATMGAYRTQSQSFNRGNQSINNGIYNENTVTNPYNGTSHQSDANYGRTFMNASGEQIQTNNQFYQPQNGYQEVYPDGGGF